MTASPLRAILSGSIGNLVAWYEWYGYPAFTRYCASVFFLKASAPAWLLNPAVLLAVSFLVRSLSAARPGD